MQVSTQFANYLVSLGVKLFPDFKHVDLRGVAEPVPLPLFLKKTAEKLAEQCTGPREVAFRVIRECIEKLHRLGRLRHPRDFQYVMDAFSSNVNLIHVIHKAPEDLPELQVPLRDLFSQNSEAMDHLGIKTLLHHVGMPGDLQRDPHRQRTWLLHARQARRILASPDDFFDPEVKFQLRLSYGHDIKDYFASSTAARYLERWMTLHNLNESEWLRPTFSKTYDAEAHEQRSMDVEAQYSLHKSFYDSLYRLHATRTIDNPKLLKHFFRTVAENDPSKSELPADFIVQAHQWYKTHDWTDPGSDRFKLSRDAMNKVLLYAHQKMQRCIVSREHRVGSVPEVYTEFHDHIVALQRMVAGYDHSVSLTTGRTPESEVVRRVQYNIEPSDKDPIHFYTGGNDTGVCDSTAGPQRGTLKDSALNPSVQFHEIFRVDARGRRNRIGQIRMYMGEISKGAGHRLVPAILVNSIDLEAEERDNLLLYRRAVDYVKEFAQRVGVTELRLGRHGDQHLMVFEESGKFPDLRPVQENIRLKHFFDARRVKPFSDFFRGASYSTATYHHAEGMANLYHVALPLPVIRRKR